MLESPQTKSPWDTLEQNLLEPINTLGSLQLLKEFALNIAGNAPKAITFNEKVDEI